MYIFWLVVIGIILIFIGGIMGFDFDSGVGKLLIGLGIFTIFFMFFVVVRIQNDGSSEYILNSAKQIVALQDNNNISGKCFLGCGNVEADLYYQYMTVEKDGSYKPSKIKADEAKVYCTNARPRIERCEKRRTWWIFYATKDVTKIYVPKGTIQNNYDIDLK